MPPQSPSPVLSCRSLRECGRDERTWPRRLARAEFFFSLFCVPLLPQLLPLPLLLPLLLLPLPPPPWYAPPPPPAASSGPTARTPRVPPQTRGSKDTQLALQRPRTRLRTRTGGARGRSDPTHAQFKKKFEWEAKKAVGLEDMVLVSKITDDAITENVRKRYNEDLIYVRALPAPPPAPRQLPSHARHGRSRSDDVRRAPWLAR